MSVREAYWKAVGKLRPEQLDRLSTIEWLLDTSDSPSVRRSGRTTLMALGFLKTAFSQPGSAVYFFDHLITSRRDDASRMREYVARILVDHFGDTSDVRFSRGSAPSIKAIAGWTHVIEDSPDVPVVYVSKPGKPVLAGETGADSVLEDVRASVSAALRLGISSDRLMDAVREAVVRTTMED